MPGELTVLGAVIEAGNAPLPATVGRLIEHAPESFDDERAGKVAAIVKTMRAKGEPIDAGVLGSKYRQFLDFIIHDLVGATMGLNAAECEALECWKAYQVRRAKAIASELGQSLSAAPNQAPAIIAAARSAFDRLARESCGLGERLAKRLYSPLNKPTEPEPRYYLAGVPICTPANLTAVSAQAKAGKTAAIGAMIASTYAISGSDCLGFTSQNPNGFAVVHFDTEQSPFDHWDAMRRAQRRAGAEALPPWIRSYCLTGFSPGDIRSAIRLLMEQEFKQFGGIHSAFLDGAADVVQDVNDPAESGELVTELHELAIRYNAPFLNIIHLNPGSLAKTRGHLGSQLERKSETNLRLEKDEAGATVVWADKNRRAPIPKETAPRFAWCNQAGMHISIESRQSSKLAGQIEDMQTEASAVFSAAGKSAIRYGQFIDILIKEVHMSTSTAKRRLSQMLKTGVITKELTGIYELTKK